MLPQFVAARGSSMLLVLSRGTITWKGINMTNFDKTFKLNCLTMNITSKCNLDCVYCFEKNKGDDFMSCEDAITMFEKGYKNFKANYDEGYFYVAFFGGEPFLNFKVIRAVIDYARENGYDDCSFGVTSNLTIMTDEMAEYIDDNNLHIIVSIDGTKEIHDANRCGSYDLVEKNVKKLIELGAVRLLEARMTLTPENIGSMYEGVLNVIDMGIDNINPLFVVDMTWNGEQFKELLNQTEKLIKLVINVSNDPDNKRNISIKTIEEKIVYCYSYENRESIPCTFGSNAFISVDSNGNMMPCHQRHYRENSEVLELGNLLKDEILADNLKGRIVPHSWRSEVKSLDCKTCKGRSLCRGWCPSENYDLRNDILEVPALMCFYNIALSEMVPFYQEKIMNAQNLRSHTLNMLKYSLHLLTELNEIKELDPANSEFIARLIDFNSKIIIEKDMILPAFASTIYEQVCALKKEFDGGEQ